VIYKSFIVSRAKVKVLPFLVAFDTIAFLCWCHRCSMLCLSA